MKRVWGMILGMSASFAAAMSAVAVRAGNFDWWIPPLCFGVYLGSLLLVTAAASDP